MSASRPLLPGQTSAAFARMGETTLLTLRQTRVDQVAQLEAELEPQLRRLERLRSALKVTTDEIERRGLPCP